MLTFVIISIMTITALSKVDIPFLSVLQPEGWNDIRRVFSTHIGRPYFEAFKTVLDGQLVAVGHTMYCQGSAWLGNIIVAKNFRNSGLGKEITLYLISKILKKNIDSIFLLATELGKPVYEAVGFKERHRFSFIKFGPSEISMTPDLNIEPYHIDDMEAILSLDRKATGEDRSPIIKYFMGTGKVMKNSDGDIEGFYLPDLGDGLIIAANVDSGITLSQYRYLDGKRYVVLPDNNLEFLFSTHIKFELQQRKAYYMHLGPWKSWTPKMIYCRVGGYLG